MKYIFVGTTSKQIKMEQEDGERLIRKTCLRHSITVLLYIQIDALLFFINRYNTISLSPPFGFLL